VSNWFRHQISNHGEVPRVLCRYLKADVQSICSDEQIFQPQDTASFRFLARDRACGRAMSAVIETTLAFLRSDWESDPVTFGDHAGFWSELWGKARGLVKGMISSVG